MDKPKLDTELELIALALGGIVWLETLALLKGIDGTIFGLAIGGVSGICGWIIKGYYKQKKKR